MGGGTRYLIKEVIQERVVMRTFSRNHSPRGLCSEQCWVKSVTRQCILASPVVFIGILAKKRTPALRKKGCFIFGFVLAAVLAACYSQQSSACHRPQAGSWLVSSQTEFTASLHAPKIPCDCSTRPLAHYLGIICPYTHTNFLQG